MPLGHVLYEPGIQMRHVCFPTTSIVSLPYVMEDGASAEIAVVGNEGNRRYLPLHGGRNHPQASRRAKRRPRLPGGQLLKEEFISPAPCSVY